MADALATLANNPPPAMGRKSMRFINVGKCNAEITRLETELGIEPGKPTWNIHRANARVIQLEQMLAGKASNPSAAASALPTPAAALPTLAQLAAQLEAQTVVDAPKPELTGRARMLASVKIEGQSASDYDKSQRAEHNIEQTVAGRARTATTLPASASAKPSFATLRALSVAAFGHDLALRHWSDDESQTYNAVHKAFYQAHLKVTGLSDATFEAAGTWRPTAEEMSKGRARAVRFTSQTAIDKFLAKKTA